MRSTTLIPALLAATAVVTAQSHNHPAADPTAAALKQIRDVQDRMRSLATTDQAGKAGYEPVLGWIPMMGTHWVHGPRMLQGPTAVSRAEPSQLMFSPINGKDTLVGVAYAYYAPNNDTSAPPVLFDGAPGWHDHPNLAPPGTNLLMLHVWFVSSPDGPFAGLNPFLPYWAAKLTPPTIERMSDPVVSVRVRKAAIALAEVVDPTGLFPIIARRPAVRPVLEERREAIRALMPQLETARNAADQAGWDAIADKLGEHWEVMREAYLKSALDPAVKARIAKTIDEMVQGRHDHRP
jgi:hypothetical protein